MDAFLRVKRSNKSAAQSLIEFALLLPLLLLLILGAMDLGRLVTTKLALTNAAREGANFLSRNAFADEDVTLATRIQETKEIIKNEGQNAAITNVIITDGEIDIPLGASPACCTSGLPVSVTITQQVTLIYGNILQFLGFGSGSVEVSGAVQMRVK